MGCRPKPNKANSNQVSGIIGCLAEGLASGPQNQADTRRPRAFVTVCQHALPASGSGFTRQMVVEPIPDSCRDLALGHPLSCPQSYLSPSCQLSADHLFWARSSNLVFTYYQEACLCDGCQRPGQAPFPPARQPEAAVGNAGSAEGRAPGDGDWPLAFL